MKTCSDWGNRINNLFQNPWFKEELALPWNLFSQIIWLLLNMRGEYSVAEIIHF